VVAACRWIGYGLGPLFGAFADKYNRRSLLLIITSSSILYSFALAFLVTMDLVQYWHVILIALAASLAHGFDLPLRYAFTSDIVDKRILTNAVALNTVAIDVTAILGPALAGPLVNVIGVGGVSWVLTGNYILNVLALYMIRGITKPVQASDDSLKSKLMEGVRYIRSHPPVFALLGMAFAFNFFQFPLRHALMPVFADSVLDVGAAGFGFLLAASGAGALLGAAIIAWLGDFRYKAWLCIIASVAAGIASGVFSQSPWYSLSLGFMGCVGLAEAISMTTMAALLLLLTPNEMRGRVMGVRSFAILPLSLGSLMSGAIADYFGAPTAGTINAALQVLSILIIAITVSGLRRSG
jgi:MFS family permease